MYRILLSTQFYTLVCIGKKEGKREREGGKGKGKGEEGKKMEIGNRERRGRKGKKKGVQKQTLIITMKLQIDKGNAEE